MSQPISTFCPRPCRSSNMSSSLSVAVMHKTILPFASLLSIQSPAQSSIMTHMATFAKGMVIWMMRYTRDVSPEWLTAPVWRMTQRQADDSQNTATCWREFLASCTVWDSLCCIEGRYSVPLKFPYKLSPIWIWKMPLFCHMIDFMEASPLLSLSWLRCSRTSYNLPIELQG